MIRKTLIHLLLLAGLAVVLFPFAWMISTSLKAPHAVGEFPPQFIPREQVMWTDPQTGMKYPVFELTGCFPQGRVVRLRTLPGKTEVAELLLKGECLIDLFAAGKDVRHLQAGRQVATLKNLLDILSEIEPEPSPSLQELKEEVFEEIGGLGNAIVILLGYDQERRDFVAKLQERGVSVKLLLIGDGWLVPENTTVLSAADIMAGRVLNL